MSDQISEEQELQSLIASVIYPGTKMVLESHLVAVQAKNKPKPVVEHTPEPVPVIPSVSSQQPEIKATTPKPSAVRFLTLDSSMD
jgi:hypothetical protein